MHKTHFSALFTSTLALSLILHDFEEYLGKRTAYLGARSIRRSVYSAKIRFIRLNPGLFGGISVYSVAFVLNSPYQLR